MLSSNFQLYLFRTILPVIFIGEHKVHLQEFSRW